MPHQIDDAPARVARRLQPQPGEGAVALFARGLKIASPR